MEEEEEEEEEEKGGSKEDEAGTKSTNKVDFHEEGVKNVCGKLQ